MNEVTKAVKVIGLGTCFAIAVTVGASSGDAVTPQGAAKPKAPGRTTTASQGVPRFQFDGTWPKPLPNDWILGTVVGVAVDARDHVWIVQRPGSLRQDQSFATRKPPAAMCCYPAPPVLEFDQVGNVVQGWGGPGTGYEWPTRGPDKRFEFFEFAGEHGLSIDHQNNVWLGSTGETAGQVLKFTRAGKFLLQIGRQGGQTAGSSDQKNFHEPTLAVVDPKTNEAYVADGYVNRRVVVVDASTGAYKRHWGAYGETPDDKASTKYNPDAPPSQQFTTVHCVRLSSDGLVYVCDQVNNRIQAFRKDGSFVKEVQIAPRTLGYGAVSDIAFSPDPGNRFMYVADGMNQKVWILRRDDLEVLDSFGSGGHNVGSFDVLHSLAVDSKGNIYTGETREGKRVQRFKYVGLGPATAAR